MKEKSISVTFHEGKLNPEIRKFVTLTLGGSMIDEMCSIIEGFPNYSVSNHGNIYHNLTGRKMATSQTSHGHVKISLINFDILQTVIRRVESEDGHFEGYAEMNVPLRRTLSVAQLVGREFVVPPDHQSNAIIVLNGDVSNVVAWNLAWRPRWYAWKYARQLHVQQPRHYQNLKVQNLITRGEYPSVIHAGISEGLLFEDIWRSTYTGDRIYPYGHSFIISERV